MRSLRSDAYRIAAAGRSFFDDPILDLRQAVAASDSARLRSRS